MAFLMLLHEKLRLQRKVNTLTLKQLRASSRKDRMTKQIERVQKMYSKRESQLEAQYKRMQNMASLSLNNFFGMASNQISTNWQTYTNGNNLASNLGMQQLMAQGFAAGAFKDSAFGNNMQDLQSFMSEGWTQSSKKDPNDNTKTIQIFKNASGKEVAYSEDKNSEYQQIIKKMADANQIQQMVSMQYQNNNSLCQNAIQNYNNNISIWLEYEKEKLEAEQDEVLAPLQEQETDWDMESQSAAVQIESAKERLRNLEQALSDGIKDSTPKFGLG